MSRFYSAAARVSERPGRWGRVELMSREDLRHLRWFFVLCLATASFALPFAAFDSGWTREVHDPQAEDGSRTARLAHRAPGGEEMQWFLLLRALPLTLGTTALLLVPDVIAWRRRRAE
jgi:hypothetical protein